MHNAWSSGTRPSVAGTLTLKQCSRVHQNMAFSFKKLKNFLGRPPAAAPTSWVPTATRPLAPCQNPKYATAGEIGKLVTTNHASGPESIASDVNDPSNLIDKADVDDVEDNAEQSDDKAGDADSKRLDVVERRDDVPWVTEVQQ